MKAAVLTGVAALTLFDISASTAQAQSFAGAYAGIQAGVRWDDIGVQTPAYSSVPPAPCCAFSPGSDGSFTSVSPLIGGHVGVNAMITPLFLLGLEGDFDAAFNSGSGDALTDFCQPSFSCVDGIAFKFNQGPQATLRGRAGLVTGGMLFYGTAGLAVSEIHWEASAANSGSTGLFPVSQDSWKTGYAIGGGVETFLNPSTILRTEYLYENFGSISVPLPDTAQTGSLNVVSQKLRAGLSFKF